MSAGVLTVPPRVVRALMDAPELRALAVSAAKNEATLVGGLWGSSIAAVATAIARRAERPILLVCGHVDEADDLADDVELFLGDRPEVLVALETAGGLGQASEELVADRMRLLARLAGARTHKRGAPNLVAPIQALMQAVPDPSELKHLSYSVRTGQELEPEKLIVWLADHGYNRLDSVEMPGDYAVRGGIIDVYLPGKFDTADESGLQQIGLPVRIDFYGDQVESIRRFNIDTLGSEGKLPEIEFVDLKGKLETGQTTSALKYVPDDAIVIFWAPLEIAEQAKSYLDRAPDQRGFYPVGAVLKLVGERHVVEASQFETATVSLVSPATASPRVADDARGKPCHFTLPVRSLVRFETETKKALAELEELAKTHDVAVFCENRGEQQRFREILAADIPAAADSIETPIGYLHRGFVYGEESGTASPGAERSAAEEKPWSDGQGARHGFSSPRRLGDGEAVPLAGDGDDRPLALISHHEIFHRYELRRRVKNKGVATRQIDSFLDLNVGDYVVHVAHGIARFTGMQTMEKDGRNEEYLTLRFADNAALYVPASHINLVQKYVGGFTGHPTLSRLGSGTWEKQKARVSEAVADMAAELLEVQARRAAQVGHAFGPDSDWQHEFEAEFPYTPTEDQVSAAEEIKQDMTRPRPMDRLLCGDVGYGKTELAMRAAFKAVEAGKQVAVLVPTTVLAEQHERSFRERMANYPFNITSLSRFKSDREAKEIIERLKAGDMDIVIGTHKLLGKDISFADLGLVVIDEEQRFGVTHKEKLKQLRTQVDVLTMSATPIPRTLHMSMVGLRDISSLTTPPQDRRSIVTEILNFDEQRIKLAILRELQREGQVYFVHNRVYNIKEMAAVVQQLVPEARILIGHGQMNEGELEQVMLKFIRHEADILVSTTIIESGLDIPNVNTIFINQADRFGLSELHQLRGRVGRYKHRAYCYLLLPPDRPVTEIAAKRLKAIEEFSHLGAGFKIAMRDLELRGAGNILGPEQSGHIAAVGYEMYCQLLEEATRRLKNEPAPTRPEAHVEIDITAYIPKQYIPVDRQRMDVYRRLSRCTSIEMLADLQRDLADAFGGGSGNEPRPSGSGPAHEGTKARSRGSGTASPSPSRRGEEKPWRAPEGTKGESDEPRPSGSGPASDNEPRPSGSGPARSARTSRSVAAHEVPRQMTILYALTELRLLASHFGIDSIVRKPPDVVMTVRDARKATEALARAPGRLTVLDTQTVYFRPPAVFIEPEPLLMTLRNLLMKAYEASVGGPASSRAAGGSDAAQSAQPAVAK